MHIALRKSGIATTTSFAIGLAAIAMTSAAFAYGGHGRGVGSVATSIPMANRGCQGATIEVAPDDQKVAMEACVRDESDAKDTLEQRWGSFSATAKDDCAEPAGLPLSYVELLTCLEMESGQFGELRAMPLIPTNDVTANDRRLIRSVH